VARIRTIKPELLEDERTALLTHLEWRLFVSLLLLADDYGNFRAAPGRVKGTALWAFPDVDVASALRALDAYGLLELYEVDGQAYGHISGWSKHQKVDHPGKPTCPGPETHGATRSRESREEVATVSRLTGIGSEGTGIGPERASAPARDPSATATEDEPPPAHWSANDWKRRYGEAWCGAYRQLAYGMGGDGKAISSLAGFLGAMTPDERSMAQLRAAEMFAEFLADRTTSNVDRRHPFAFFVAAFNGLRVDRKTGQQARAGPPADVRVGHARAETARHVGGERKL